MSDPTDATAPDDRDPSGEPVAQIPEGPLAEELHIGEPLSDEEEAAVVATAAVDVVPGDEPAGGEEE
jgi:hypothetical protein